MTETRLNRIEAVLAHRQMDLTVVLENVFDPHNISAVMRSCDAVGVQEIYVLNTKIPPHEKWCRRKSSGALKWLTVHQFDNLNDCLSALRSKYRTILTTRMTGDARTVFDLDFTESTALVFGNEIDGVSDEIYARADGNFLIPQVGMVPSLNISVACAVTLYEAFRQKQAAGHYRQSRLSQQQSKQLQNEWGMHYEKLD